MDPAIHRADDDRDPPRILKGGGARLRPIAASLLALFCLGYRCADDLLVVRNANDYPTRLAWAPDGKLYVSDAKTGSVFIYDRQPGLTLIGELKGLDTPLGVAVDSSGAIYVGNNGRDNVEVYSPLGLLLWAIGEGTIQMPNDLALDDSGKLYVADSRAGRVWVYGVPEGTLLGSIGGGELRFPSALALVGGELFVADQADHLVKVFDLQGNLLRSLGGPVGQGMMGYSWRGSFVRLQSLAVDATGRLHAADSHMSIIQMLDASTGSYLGFYGSKGTDPGQLNLPLDIALDGLGEVAVANTENRRVEILTVP
jgi:DNA-binding beta-propeller fold protein YncE